MSDSPDNVVQLGGGGLLYQDARDQAREQAARLRAESDAVTAEDLAACPPPPWADKPEPAPPAEPAKQSVVSVKAPPEPPKQPRSYREPLSTMLELAGIALLITTGFLIAVWVGTLIAGLSLVVLGVATSGRIGG